MKNVGNLKAFGVLALIGAGLLATGLMFTGCKTAPSLTAADAQALIQAKYDQTAAVGANIAVNDLGMRQGATALMRMPSSPCNASWASSTRSSTSR